MPQWLVNKIRTDLAMKGIKLNARDLINNLQNMHEKSPPPTGARRRMELEYKDWARLQGRRPHTGGYNDRLVGWWMWQILGAGWTRTPPVDSIQINRLHKMLNSIIT